MLDPLIASYKLTTNVYSYLLEHSQYLLNNTYNNTSTPKYGFLG